MPFICLVRINLINEDVLLRPMICLKRKTGSEGSGQVGLVYQWHHCPSLFAAHISALNFPELSEVLKKRNIMCGGSFGVHVHQTAVISRSPVCV